ncbi:MAG: hypothetical protein AB7Y46_12995 [Armatimonadota bacterium]
MPRRAAGAETRRLLVGAVAALVVTGALAGCGAKRPASEWRPHEPREAYAYTAVLMARHPLYRALGHLEAALDDLGEEEWEPVLEPIDERFEQMAFLESSALGDPAEHLRVLDRQWQARYPDLALEPGALGRDLRARVDWEQRRARSVVSAHLARERAAESRRIAQMRAELVRQYQERITNLRIRAELGDQARAQRARSELEQVWAVIDAQVAAEEAAGQELLAQLEAELESEARGRIEAVRGRADELTASRRAEMSSAGGELYAQMLAEMAAPWPAAPEGGEVAVQAEAPNARLIEAEGLREQAGGARDEAMREQRVRLLRAIGALRARLKSGTETAARVVAYRDGIRLRLVPGEPAGGENLTGSMAERLEAFWRQAEEQRS